MKNQAHRWILAFVGPFVGVDVLFQGMVLVIPEYFFGNQLYKIGKVRLSVYACEYRLLLSTIGRAKCLFALYLYHKLCMFYI